ncbi:MAG: hypothetical protein HYT46_02780 [Candidatus Vogelbacteria bacterium]|nr:hypothetical protein [Candidatus Vogelbacteria bacterium]
MKKLGIIIFVILLFSVWGLWYLGGQKIAAPATAPTGLNEDEKLVALVQKTRTAAGRPLLDPAGAAGGAASAFQVTENDLLIATGAGAAETRRYIQAVSQLFQNSNSGRGRTSPGSELELALEALEKQSPVEAAAVKQGAEYYGRLAAGLRALAPPLELKYVHLNLLQAVLDLAELDSYLAEILTEPILALDQAPIFAHRYERLAGAVMILNQVLAVHNLPLIAAL